MCPARLNLRRKAQSGEAHYYYYSTTTLLARSFASGLLFRRFCPGSSRFLYPVCSSFAGLDGPDSEVRSLNLDVDVNIGSLVYL